MSKKKTLEDIFNDDDLGILDTKAKVSNVKSEDERLIDSFQEINAFFEKNKREPKADVFVVSERSLGVRLKGLRNNPKDIEILKPYDVHQLLGEVVVEINSVDDILNDDVLGILDTDDALEIFKLKNVPKSSERNQSDFVAQRKAMKKADFAPYEPIFKKIHEELKIGSRKLVNFNYENLRVGEYYIDNGILLYLESVAWEKQVQQFKSGVHNRPDGRAHIIFENGTQSNMMFQSLYKALHFNGKMVTNPDDHNMQGLFATPGLVSEEDLQTGWIYILKSKSSNKRIAEIKDLYKIGFSKIEVKDRIKNANREPTYLMSDVEVIATYKCYNVNVHKFEKLLHRFFAEVCLNVDIHDDKGRRITPREWFVAPFGIIDKAIDLILNGEIVNFKYDSLNQVIFKHIIQAED